MIRYKKLGTPLPYHGKGNSEIGIPLERNGDFLQDINFTDCGNF